MSSLQDLAAVKSKLAITGKLHYQSIYKKDIRANIALITVLLEYLSSFSMKS